MNTKTCADHVEEFANYVAECDALSEEAEVHLQNCACCQQKVAELQKVAALCQEQAQRLPEPGRRLHWRALERSLAGEWGESRFTLWRPLLAGGLAIAVALALSVMWKPSETLDPSTPANALLESSVKEQAVEPTMLVLHNALQGDREQILVFNPKRNAISHYRVRDVERELK